jgi:hypothetical protein
MPPRKKNPNVRILPFEGEGTIIDTTVIDELESSYLDYS